MNCIEEVSDPSTKAEGRPDHLDKSGFSLAALGRQKGVCEDTRRSTRTVTDRYPQRSSPSRPWFDRRIARIYGGCAWGRTVCRPGSTGARSYAEAGKRKVAVRDSVTPRMVWLGLGLLVVTGRRLP